MSIKFALKRHCREQRQSRWDRMINRLGLVHDYRRYRFRTHISLRSIERRLPESMFDSYFKFAVVRNPWDLLVSEYNYYFKGSDVHTNRRRHRHRWLYTVNSFEEFVHAKARRRDKLQFDRLTKANGDLGLDFIARFERLPDDFQRICEVLGVEATLQHVNRSEHRPYLEYFDDTTYAFVAEAWATDIQSFGYESLNKGRETESHETSR